MTRLLTLTTRPLLAALLAMAAACSNADDTGSDPGGDDLEGYDEHDGTGAGADDGDGPDDNIPNEEDEKDVEAGIDIDGDVDPAELGDLAELSATPDEYDPFLEPDEATALLRAPDAMLREGCIARSRFEGATAWFFFVRPDAPCRGEGAGKDRNAMAELIRIIRSVPAGGRIDGHIFNISIDQVARELNQARKRGVDVYISTDGQIADSQDVAKVVYLDWLKHKTYCDGDNRACIATIPRGISHTKLFVFSRATQPDGTVSDNVVWFGSANQTFTSGTNMFNDTVTLYGAEGLYRDLKHYLQDLFEQKKTDDYYKWDVGRGYIRRDVANVYISPESETDLIVHRLDDLTPTSGCEVRVMQSMIKDNRLSVVDRLVQMKKGGCDVRVVSNHPEPEAVARLKAAGIPVRHNNVHNKVFIIRGKYNGTTKYRVYTGSHNVAFGARLFDEIFVKLAPETGSEHPVYDAYVQHFSDAYEDGEPL
ncbi:MAG TPA: hypothetical protein VFU21_05995 [Kofleriaceae bacterium]|nr:hypothetical protein [Kofleriaceae bacterium]